MNATVCEMPDCENILSRRGGEGWRKVIPGEDENQIIEICETCGRKQLKRPPNGELHGETDEST